MSVPPAVAPASPAPPVPATGAAAWRAGALRRAGTHLALPAALGTGLALWDPARHGGPPSCPWALLTGQACPGCGLTRAVGALLRGRVHEALDWHPLAPLLVAQVAIACVAYVVLGPSVRSRAPSALLPAVLVANAALLLGAWVVRGLTGDLAGLA